VRDSTASAGRGKKPSMDPREPRSPGRPAVTLLDESSAPLDRANEPPVVARLMVEIRSDGTTTIARGAMEDAQSGQKVAILAKGTTPLALALSLAKSLASAPWLAATARGALRALKGR
jgi:hypothetical protein